MSVSRDNVVWQSADGTWSRGFYAEDRWYPDDDGEPEVEFRHDEFDWVSTGHPTEDAAADSWHGANPGGRDTVPFPKTDEERAHWSDEVERLDDLAAQLWASPYRAYSCHGAPKSRVPRYLAREIAKATSDAAYDRIEGYANQPTDVSTLASELRARLPELSAAERAAVSEELAKGVERIDKQLEPKPTYSRRPRPAGAAEDAVSLRESLRTLDREVTTPAPKTRPEPATARAKTTSKSTAGSFAPKTHSAPDVSLGGAPGT